jgi:hypothetical protein
MNQQDQLNRAYHRLFDRQMILDRLGQPDSADLLRQLNGPFLLATNDDYERISPRAMIFGQENNGWLEGHYLFWLTTLGLEDCLSPYRSFDIGGYRPGVFGRYFALLRRTIRGEITDDNRRSVLWNNLFKFNHDGKATIYSPLLQAILKLQGDIVLEEIKVLRPDVVIFLTGPRYDWVIEQLLNATIRPLSPFPKNELAHVVSASLPPLSFRTYHPGYLNRVYRRKPYCLPAIFDRIKDRFPTVACDLISRWRPGDPI